MGKTILTPKQSQFLELISHNPGITKNFYLTGGTALSEFYLHHRLSEDIDLFCEKTEVSPVAVEAFLKKISPILGISKITQSIFMGLLTYVLAFRDNSTIKVDFNYYPFPRIQKGTKIGSLEVDSIKDIAANKLQVILTKPRSRDFIDLYFIFKSQNYSLQDLILDSKAKFDWHIDPLILSSQFMRAKDLTDFPKMIVPFSREEMQSFYLKLTKGLKSDILK